MSQADKTAAERCYLPADGGTATSALDPVKVAGKMIICYRGGNVLINKAAAAQGGGRSSHAAAERTGHRRHARVG